MKTPSKILAAALFGVALTAGVIAGPGIQYWQNHGTASKPAPAVTSTAPAATPCATMIENRARVSRETNTAAVVTCTPEMRLNNARCREACGM